MKAAQPQGNAPSKPTISMRKCKVQLRHMMLPPGAGQRAAVEHTKPRDACTWNQLYLVHCSPILPVPLE